jgi:hypothetical protein
VNYANVTATLALLLAVAGGTAYAVDKITSHDIANNSIRSADLKNRKAVRGKDVKPNGLTGRQINEETLHLAATSQVAGNATGNECMLQSAPRNCVTAAIRVERRSRLLVIATGNEESVGGAAAASCRLAIDGRAEPLSVAPGEARTDNTEINATNGFARTLMSSSPVAAGQHFVALRCERLAGQARIDEPTIAVIAVTAG